MTRRLLIAALGIAAVMALVPPSPALAGGMFLTDRGTRPLGRGFAFVAGADDAGALAYNPAGIAFAGRQLFLDATLTLMDADYTRVDGGGNVLPTVSLESPPIPIPMLAYTDDFGLPQLTFGAGVFAPNVVPQRWPEEIDAGGVTEPAPQRYSLIDLDGSAVAHVVVGAAYRPMPELSVGATLHLVVGRLRALTALSACDRVICTQPENPEYDGLSELDLPILSPTFTAGVVYATDMLRLGASFTAPYSLGGSATIKVRPPSAALFDDASVEGDSAEVTLWMPWILRGGVELRPVTGLRVEGALVYEGWGVQDEMRVVPENVWLRDVTAIGDYQIGTITVPREMNDVISVRLGGEYAIGQSQKLVIRAGANYETAGFDDEYLTPLTLDSSKLIIGLGASYEVADGLFIDASYGHVFLTDREVSTSLVPQANPIRPPPMSGAPPDGPVHVGNGSYAMEANIFGLGLRWTLAPPAEASEETGEEAAETAPAEQTDDANAPLDEPAVPAGPAPPPVEEAPPIDEGPEGGEPADAPEEGGEEGTGDDTGGDVPWYLRGGTR